MLSSLSSSRAPHATQLLVATPAHSPGDSSPGCHFPTSSWAGSGDSPAQGLCLTVALQLSVVERMGFTFKGCLRSCLPRQDLVRQGSLASTGPSTYTHTQEVQTQPSKGVI